MPLEGNSLKTSSVTHPISHSEDWNVGSQISNIEVAEADTLDTLAKMEGEGAVGLMLAAPLVAVTKII